MNMKKNKYTMDSNSKLVEAFGKDIPANYRPLVVEGFSKVVTEVSGKVRSRFHLDVETAESFATEAAFYVLAGCQSGKVAWPATAKDWANMATKKAINLGRDLYDYRKRHPMSFFDEEQVNVEGEIAAESPLMGEASMAVWHRQQEEHERLLKNKAVDYATLKIADQMPTKGTTVFRNRKIIRAAYLDDIPVPEICQRYGIKANNIYQILFRFRDAFKESGKKYMDEYFEYYADDCLQAA